MLKVFPIARCLGLDDRDLQMLTFSTLTVTKPRADLRQPVADDGVADRWRAANPALRGIAGVALSTLALYVSLLREVFLLAQPHPIDLAAVAAGGLAAVLWMEMQKAGRWFRVIAGFTLLAVGIALLVLPGPGWLIIAGGLALLATEYAWARWLLARVKRGGRKITERMISRPNRQDTDAQ